ncbi:peptide chain release factor H [Pseudophaeobacter sp.]|uniref:peptide chain release factor H n=1 Tax=Pseudophaeobacter sp. TaxID=1971739 RepID=UPI003299444C
MTSETHVALLVTAGEGPAECNQAVGHILHCMQQEADHCGLDLSIHRSEGQQGPKSSVVLVHGAAHMVFAKSWIGTIQWRMQSQLRRHHKRCNWFVGVFALAQIRSTAGPIRQDEVAFSTLRAGGPGGQHQNTTDSAVRATHSPTGLTVVVREARSQHRNKALALARLQSLSDAQTLADQEAQRSQQNGLHRALERGNPLRVFDGARFKEDLKARSR